MDYKVTYHDNPQAYRDISSDWKFTLRRNESGTWIFPPLAGVSYLVQQFVLDRSDISTELYGDKDTLAIVDCTVSETVHTKASAEQELYTAIIDQLALDVPETVTDLNRLVTWLGGRHIKLALLVYGLDAALRAGNMEALTMLNRLAMNYRFLSVMLILCTDATDPQFWPAFSKYAALIQNISIVPRKGAEEGQSFLRSLEQSWGVKLTADQKRWIEDNLDYSLRFTKEVFRQVQKNPALTYDELFTVPSLEYKAQALLDNLLEDQRELILHVVFGMPLTSDYNHALEYLTTIRWITMKNGQPVLTIPFIDHYIRNHDRKNVADRTVELTQKEEAAFTLLQSRHGEIVTRDELADAIWGDNAAERYSDWAIDQLIHRLKAKIGTENNTISIRVVRGRGFVLEEKLR